MLTRFVRNQLIIFTIASIVGLAVMIVQYVQAPTLLGIGRITVTMELPASGGLYRFSNVTYRGMQIGKVTSLRLTHNRAEATLSLATTPKIPEDLHAFVRSVSAVGEQYVDLRPDTDAGPYLENGSTIPIQRVTLPQPIGPVLDRVSGLVDSIPKDKLGDLLDESFEGFNGSGYDVESLIESTNTLIGAVNGAADNARSLVDGSVPLLDSQANSTDAIRTWARSLAGVTGQIRADDPQIRTLLSDGPGAVREASALLSQVQPTLPVLLANLTTIGQILVTYNPSLEQLLVLLPPHIAATQSQGSTNNPTGLPLGDFAMTMGDPTPCTVGYLPPSAWRSPADVSDRDTPDGLYCKLPQDSPIAVRGARNYPCMGHPGKRAPTVEICDSDRPFEPLAMRQHALGPYPIDPNLVAQGVPPDDRVNADSRLYAPVEGTQMPPDSPASAAPEQLPPVPPDAPPASAAVPQTEPPAPPGAPTVAPSAFDRRGADRPTVAAVQYDPHTGRYLASDGRVYRQPQLTADSLATSWKDMVMPA